MDFGTLVKELTRSQPETTRFWGQNYLDLEYREGFGGSEGVENPLQQVTREGANSHTVGKVYYLPF